MRERRNDEEVLCTLKIRNVRNEHNGPWKCEIREEGRNGDREERYVFLTVLSSLKLTLKPDRRQVAADEDEEAEMMCRTKSRFVRGQRPICSWIAPKRSGRFIRKNGRDKNRRRKEDERKIYDVSRSNYDREGIYQIGDPTKGECGIRIDRVDPDEHYGTWTCKVLRTTRGDGRPGSEVVTGEVELVPARSGRVDELRRLQGFEEGDEDVEVSNKIDIDPDDRRVELYWIVQRRYKIDEGDEECPDRDCYESGRARELENDVYSITLKFDELTLEDIETPIVLVKKYRTRSGDILHEMSFLPTSEQNVEFVCGESCSVNGRTIAAGESYEDLRSCLEIFCDDDGKVEVEKLNRCDDDDDK